MTANFSLNRLGKLIVKQWVEHRRLYLVSTLALLGLLGIIFMIWLSTTGDYFDENSLYVTGLFGLFITGSIFAGTTFNMLGAKDKGIYWISFPASHAEKLFTQLFFNVIVFTIVYACCFFLLKTLMEAYINFLVESDPSTYTFKRVNWKKVDGSGDMMPIFVSAFFAVQAAFLLGSVAFKRYAIIFTLIIVAVIFFSYIFYLSKISNYYFKGFNFELFKLESYHYANSELKETYKEYFVSPVLRETLVFFMKYLIAPFLWLITWFKLKEKQI
ncbi:hypothetical protein ABDK00_016315 [Niabella insulamsoli]|uniref:hypothetical protein n=1 Tax=Niabella insulamsoli TaxID=3144874 RepID=UPI0031FD91CF